MTTMNTEPSEREGAPERIYIHPFQPPETCTEHEECQAAQASHSELCDKALAHYEEISAAAHHWNSLVPRAIEFYKLHGPRASVATVEGDALFAAYNQAINDALAAIRGERVDDPYAAATFINAIARKCSPHRYVAQLKERTNAGSS